jgi:hypothetical protein
LYSVTIDTTAVKGTEGALVFDLTSSNEGPNTTTILDYSHDGTSGLPETQGGLVQGDIILLLNPAPVTTIEDGFFFNELLIPFESFGTHITFTLQLSENPAPGPQGIPDEFTLFILDSEGLPLLATSDPLGADALFAICIDGSPSGQRSVYAPARFRPPDNIELVVPSESGPPPPAGPWLTTSEVPGFRTKVQITGGPSVIRGAKESACIEETLCVSGAVPGRPEVFLRVVGPRPNGYLWPTIVKFSTSQVEIWIEQLATDQVRYYLLEAVSPAATVLDLAGLADKLGFLPASAAPVSMIPEEGGVSPDSEHPNEPDADILQGSDPPPPPGPWLATSEVPGFRTKVRITAGSDVLTGAKESPCIAETLCVSGALPGRSEVFVRVVGPKPNGRLWPTIVKFSTSQFEIWIEQLATGQVRYYLLEPVQPAATLLDLAGLADRLGFLP